MPGIPSQLLELPFTAGIDEHTDARVVAPGSYLKLENAVFDRVGAVQKRSGYGALPAVRAGATAPVVAVVPTAEGEMRAIVDTDGTTPAGLVTYDSAALAWTRRSDIYRLTASARPLERIERHSASGFVATLGGANWHVWLSPSDGVYFRADDAVTGRTVVPKTYVVPGADANAQIRVAAVGTDIVVLYQSPTSGYGVRVFYIDTTTGTTGTRGATALSSVNALPSDIVAFDAGTFVVAQKLNTTPSQTSVSLIATRDTSNVGSVVLPFTTATSDAALAVTGNRIFVAYRGGAATAAQVNLARIDCVLSGSTYATTPAFSNLSMGVPVGASPLGASYQHNRVTVALRANGDVIVAYETGDRVTFTGATQAGVSYNALGNAYWAGLASHAFLQDGIVYAAMMVLPTYELATPNAPAAAHVVLVALDPGLTQTTTYPQTALAAVLIRDRAAPSASNDIHSHVTRIDSKRVQLAVPVLSLEIGPNGQDASLDAVTLDFSANTTAHTTHAPVSGLTAFPAGLSAFFDGESYVEAGFVHSPDVATEVATTGSMSIGKYGYAFVYSWRDRRGNLHRSDPSLHIYDGSTRPGVYGVTFQLRSISLTARYANLFTAANQTRIEIYRTAVNSTGPYYKIASIINNPGSSGLQSYTDTLADTSLAGVGQGFLYTNGGVLENVLPPASQQMLAHRGRLWLVSSEDPRELWYSKPLAAAEAPGFSDALVIRFDDDPGGITAIAALDDKLVIFTARRIYLLAGEGPNATGQGGAFSAPYQVTTDAGCDDMRSVLSAEDGVYFRSKLAICRLGRKLSVEYVGAPVRDTCDAYTICLGVMLDAARTRIAWLLQSGTGHVFIVYDYDKSVWTTWIVGGIVAPTAHALWQGVHIVGAGATLYQEAYGTSPSYDPGGVWVPLTIDTPWVKPAGFAGYVRVRKVHVTGRYLGYHSLRVSIYTDYTEGYGTQLKTFDVGASTPLLGGPAERVSVSVVRQKCSSLRVRIADAVSSSVAAGPVSGASFLGITLEIAALPGAARLPATNRG